MTLRVACSPGEIRVAAMQGGILTDYAIWRPGRPEGVGDVHRGRVTAVVPAMAGAFVAIAGELEGFLPDNAGAAGRTVGDVLAVTVTRDAQGGKGPRLALAADPPGAGPLALLRPGPNPVLRLAAQAGGTVTVDDHAVAASLRPALGDRVEYGPAWDDRLAAEVDALAAPVAALPGGMRAIIEPTAALVAIDLDTAGATAGQGGKATRQEDANRAALPVLARQIRLRNLSGAILLDLAGVRQRRRPAFAAAIREALAPDPAGPSLLGFTAGGLAEIRRPRSHAPLHERLAGPHAAGLAALRRLVMEADPANPPRLRAAPDVVSALTDDPVALPDLANRWGRPLVLRSDPAMPAGATAIEDTPRG